MDQEATGEARRAPSAAPSCRTGGAAARRRETAPWPRDRRRCARSPGATSGPAGRARRPAIPAAAVKCGQKPGCRGPSSRRVAVPSGSAVVRAPHESRPARSARGAARAASSPVQRHRRRGFTRGSVERIWLPAPWSVNSSSRQALGVRPSRIDHRAHALVDARRARFRSWGSSRPRSCRRADHRRGSRPG